VNKKEQILKYDVASLWIDIARLRNNIKVFSGILRKAKEKNSEENIKVYSKAIEQAKKEIAELEGYIKLIEMDRNGNSI